MHHPIVQELRHALRHAGVAPCGPRRDVVNESNNMVLGRPGQGASPALAQRVSVSLSAARFSCLRRCVVFGCNLQVESLAHTTLD